MKIVIAGAGDIGFHLAQMLAFENQDIVLIDTNQEVLDYAAGHLDVMTIRGDSSSVDILRQANVQNAKLLLAVTTSEKNNLLTASMAKKMGAKQTIARVQSPEYLADELRTLFRDMGVDSIISPQRLAALEIQRLLEQHILTDIFEFEGGKIDVIGFTIDPYSPMINKTVDEIDLMNPQVLFKPIAILRGHLTIIPRGHTIVRRSDHLYFITRKDKIEEVVEIFGKKKKNIEKVMIIGGTGISLETARLLEQHYQLTLIEQNKETCKELAEALDHTLVINGDPSNIDLLREEGLEKMDAFIALTPNSEINIITSLTAKNNNVYKAIAQVENSEYVHISQDIGVDTLINQKLIAANNIFRYVRKGQIEAITTLQGVDAEIIEFVVHKNNRLTKKPLRELHFPDKALIGGVIRGEESMIPYGDLQLQLNDKVIVFALPEAIGRVEQLFR